MRPFVWHSIVALTVVGLCAVHCFASATAASSAGIEIRKNRTYYMAIEAVEAAHWDGLSDGSPPPSSAVVTTGRTLLLYGGVGQLPFLSKANRSCTGRYCAWDYVNGGVPQAANLTAHEEAIRERLPPSVRGYNFSAAVNANVSLFDGIVMVDYEDWLLEWELADIGVAPYKEAAINYTRAKYPIITDAGVIAALARAEYEAAAMDFFMFTVAVVRSMLPNAKHVGFYGYPHYIVFDWHTASEMRSANDRLLPLWQAVGGFYPSLYLDSKSMTAFDSTFNSTMAKFDQALTECDRLRALVASVSTAATPPPSTLPFTWNRYHPGFAGKYGGDLISAHDTWLEFAYPFNRATGANTSGVIVWGYAPTATDVAVDEGWFLNRSAYFLDAVPPQP